MKNKDKKQVDVSKMQRQDLSDDLKSKQVPDDILEKYTTLIETVAATLFKSRKIPPAITFDDLKSWGIDGLLQAYKKFDKTKGAQFKTFAYYRIRGCILDHLRQEWIYRSGKGYSEFRAALQVKLADYIETSCEEVDEDSPSFDQIVDESMMIYYLGSEELNIESYSEGTRDPSLELIDENPALKHETLWKHIEGLEKDEKNLVELMYIQGMKQSEIADELSFSKSKVCRLHRKILRKLKRKVVI